jgi:hypothetical protein
LLWNPNHLLVCAVENEILAYPHFVSRTLCCWCVDDIVLMCWCVDELMSELRDSCLQRVSRANRASKMTPNVFPLS